MQGRSQHLATNRETTWSKGYGIGVGTYPSRNGVAGVGLGGAIGLCDRDEAEVGVPEDRAMDVRGGGGEFVDDGAPVSSGLQLGKKYNNNNDHFT